MSRFFHPLGLICALLPGVGRADLPAQQDVFSFVVYNVENLHDLDGIAAYDDFQGSAWTSRHLRVKLENLVSVLARIEPAGGPALIAFNEIETDHSPDTSVPGGDYTAWLAAVAGERAADWLSEPVLPAALAGLPAEAWLLKACADRGLGPYSVAVASAGTTGDEPSAIRNVLFSRFPISAIRTHPLLQARAMLEVELDVRGTPLTVLVNHWKAGASDPAAEAIRRENARVLRARLDELLARDPQADIIVTGDLNSHYNQRQRHRALRPTAINDLLGSQGNELALRGPERVLYNLWFELPSDQRGSDIYRGEWGTLMHLLLTRGLYDQNGIQYVDGSFAVMKFPGLNANALGLPLRWSRGATPGGFSDHFPLRARFRPLATKDRDQWLALEQPSLSSQGGERVVPVDSAPVDLFREALVFNSMPAGTELRGGAYTGRIFFIEADSRIDARGRVFVTLDGLDYEVYSHQKNLREKLRARTRAEGRLGFYGELGPFRDRWQFLLYGPEWLP
jgi:hypothetical protein